MYLSFDWENPQCAGHKLQLAINGGLKIPTITRAIAAARKLVGHFKDNTVASNQLKLRQERMEEPQRKLLQDCPKRWNSTFYMIQRLLANR